MNNLNLQGRKPLILVVDDERILRVVLRRAMEREGYEVIESQDGEQCLAICQAGHTAGNRSPDLILLDAMMPKMDGFTCCQRLQAAHGDEAPLVLMITALNDEESVDRAFEAGAIDFVTKPIHWAVLRQRVRRLLQTRWAMEELHRKMEEERSLKEQLEIVNQKLERIAAVDGLTQIANRRCFDGCLQHEWQRLTREQAPLSLILCDIDYFKAYNDTYGHLAGDECLQQVATVLQQAVKRPADLAARYGGEEFVILLPNTDVSGAIQVAGLIQQMVQQRSIEHRGSNIGKVLSLSFGIASLVPHSSTFATELIAEADRALYRAKLRGRNQIGISGDEIADR